jgi:hypothetical protein
LAEAQVNGLSDLGLAGRLGCAVEVLTDLRLCRLPQDAGEVAQIAGRFGCNADALAELAGVGAKSKEGCAARPPGAGTRIRLLRSAQAMTV